ncbi:MAG: LysR family transcriptional regulator [Rhizobacter sp.]
MALAEHLHFGRTATTLNISQPALSQQIQRLEKDLGSRLFVRQVGSLELTAAGLALLPRARETLSASSNCYEAVSASLGDASRRVRIAYPVSATDLVSRMGLAEFASQLPEWRIELIECSSVEALTHLNNGQADVAFTWLPLRPPSADIETIAGLSVALQVVVSSQHRLASQSDVSWSELKSETLILFDPKLNPALYDHMRSRLEDLNINIFHSGRGVRSSETAYAAAGIGFVLSSPQVDATLNNNHSIKVLPLRQDPISIQLALNYATWHVTPATRRFVAFIDRHWKRMLAKNKEFDMATAPADAAAEDGPMSALPCS